jgi:hypothetical protein
MWEYEELGGGDAAGGWNPVDTMALGFCSESAFQGINCMVRLASGHEAFPRSYTLVKRV